jgi:hypothetical protein
VTVVRTHVNSPTRIRPVQSVLLTASASGGVVAVAGWFVLAAFGLAQNTLAFVLVSVLGVAVALRGILRVSLEADANGVVVRNVWRTHHVPWSSVSSIELAGMFWPGAAALLYVFTPLRMRMQDGRSIYLQASIADLQRVVAFLRGAAPAHSALKWGFRFD